MSSGKVLAVFVAIFAVGFVTVYAQLACIECRSDVDPNCVFNPTRITGTQCNSGTTSAHATCRTRILPNATVIRQCVSAANINEACNDPNTCRFCTNDGSTTTFAQPCNVIQRVPVNRISCIQCEGHRLSTCATAQLPADGRICRAADTSCFTRVSNRLVMRGCGSDHRGLCRDATQCLTCNSDNCNVLVDTADNIPEASSATLFAVAPMAILFTLVAAML